MLNKFGVVCVVIAFFGIGMVVGVAVAPSQPSQASTFSGGTQTISQITSQTDPYLMSCDQLHQQIQSLQSSVNKADQAYGGIASSTLTSQAALLNYYTQVYNERISLYYMPGYGSAIIPAQACTYPSS